MPAPISVIVPTLNSAADLPGCLASLAEGVIRGLVRELVMVDGGSDDGTPEIAREAGAVLVAGPASRGGQLRLGTARASGEWLLVVHSDTELEPGWTEHAARHMRERPGAAGHFLLEFRARGAMPALVAGWANLRSRVFGLPYGDQGLLVPRALLEDVGGYPDQPLMEDVEVARRLRGRLAVLPSRARTSAARYSSEGWIRRGARNLSTLARYRLGASPERLAASYRK